MNTYDSRLREDSTDRPESTINFRLSRDEILSLPGEQRMAYLHSLQVKHKNLEIVANDLVRLLSKYNDTNILAIIGATGVGKTSLIRRLIRVIVERNESDISSVPFIYIAAPANGDRSVSWTTIYENILLEAEEILTNKKQETFCDGKKIIVNPRRYRTLASLRDALESMLKYRHVRVLVIDEAVHLLRFGNYAPVMDTIKSLADRTMVKVLLVGSYDLFDLATNYGQVARRAEILHFRRYRKEAKQDQAEFRSLIQIFQQHWPCDQVPDFQVVSHELFEASLGCVGILKALLLQALSLQIENDNKWRPSMLGKSAKSVKLLCRIREEIEQGERKVDGATYGESVLSRMCFKEKLS